VSKIKSDDSDITIDASGSGRDIKFQANGVEKASISSAGAFTSTTIDATKLTGNLPAISGAALTGVGVSGISSSADATAITIDSSENVGIGTGSPSVNVHIVDDATEGTPTFAGATHFAVQATASSSDNVNAALISGSAGTSRLMFGDKDDEDTGKIEYNNSTNAMSITTNTATAMTIDNSGNIVQGTASTGSNGRKLRFQSSTYTFRSGTADAYHYEFYNANGAVGRIRTSGSATAYNTSSDYRLKENVDYTWDATTRLKQLKPARFNFIADDTNTLVDGFIAHEVSSVVPEAISGEKDAMMDEEYEVTPAVEEVRDEEGNITTEAVEAVMGTRSVIDPQGIDQSKLVPLLVKTIQELEARITALEA